MENIYTVRDIKAGYLNIFTMPSDQVATRNFEDAVNDKNSVLAKHPTDMELYRLGTWNAVQGEIVAEEKPVYLASGKDFVKETKKFNELDEQTLNKVLEELQKITAEQERERMAFVEMKSNIKSVSDKADETRLKLAELDRVAKKRR